jgi:enoyl-CoA hydratase/carnithine racemase
MPEYKTLKLRSEKAVLFVEINSPPMNLIGPELVSDLVSLIELLDRGEIRVAVFSSVDPDFFIPHVDLENVTAYREAAARLTGEPSLGLLFRRLSETKAITIAMIAGRVRAAGSEFILACDLRFASRERAIFGQIEAGMGLVPGGGAVQHLTRLLGRGRALEVLASGSDYNAELAERYGWINRALPDIELSAFVSSLAHRIGSFPSAGLLAIKGRVNAIALAPAEEFRRDSELFGLGVRDAETQRRTKLLFDRGMQKRSETELNFGAALGDLEDTEK